MVLNGMHLWDDGRLIDRVLLEDMVLIASVLNGGILLGLDDRVLRVELELVVQESGMNGRVLKTILKVVVCKGMLEGKILEGRCRYLRAVTMRIERSLVGCALDKLCKVSWLVELPKLIEVGHLVKGSTGRSLRRTVLMLMSR